MPKFLHRSQGAPLPTGRHTCLVGGPSWGRLVPALVCCCCCHANHRRARAMIISLLAATTNHRHSEGLRIGFEARQEQHLFRSNEMIVSEPQKIMSPPISSKCVCSFVRSVPFTRSIPRPALEGARGTRVQKLSGISRLISEPRSSQIESESGRYWN